MSAECVSVWAVPEGIPAEGRDGSAGAAVAGVAADGAAVGEPEAGLQWGMKGWSGPAEGRFGTAACSAGVCDLGPFSVITG